MQQKIRFDVKLHPDALKEYEKLDSSVLTIVNDAIDELEIRADEIGKELRNNNDTRLAGCKEIKFRDAGIRIIYKVTNEIVHVLRIVYVLTIQKRDKSKVFKIADRRLGVFKKMPKEEVLKYLDKLKTWRDSKK